MAVQGWKEFLAQRQELLTAFEIAKIRSKHKSFKGGHGNVAEAAFREWLAGFLPRQFGVTSGYIISQGKSDEETLRHFDVIIYDRLKSPVLWSEQNPDASSSGKVRAIPAEYVLAVLEVKSTFNSAEADAAVQKLKELEPLLEKVDKPDDPYPEFLPQNFTCGVVFFTLDPAIIAKRGRMLPALYELSDAYPLRGFMGGLILEFPSAATGEASGLIVPVRNTSPIAEKSQDLEATGNCTTASKAARPKLHISLGTLCSPSSFSLFAFTLVNALNGRKRVIIPSYHGQQLNKKRGESSIKK